MSTLADRAWENRCAPLTALALGVPFLMFGNLSLTWLVIGLVAAGSWAVLWPRDAGDPGYDRGGSPQRVDAGSGTGNDRRLPLSVVDGLPDAAIVVDARGIIQFGNGAAQSLSPVPTGRALQQWMRAPELHAAVETALQSSKQQRTQVRLFSPVERSLDVLVTPIAGQGSTAMQADLLVILRDLTEQEQMARMRADFVANASHELRTPLASLRGFIETLRGAAKDDPVARARFLVIMQTQAERMSRLIEDLLSLSRIEMREHVAPTTPVDLPAIASDAIAALRPAAETAGITMALTAPAGALSVIGDRDELAQVAQNLIQNAIKYGREGGRVDVEIKCKANQVVMEVRDDGIGIPQEHLPRLTERFYRVSAKESKDRGGTGLGLAIVKHIVNRHRGELRISSTQGKGSTFTVVLPASKRGRTGEVMRQDPSAV